MTIRELYQWAEKNNAIDYPVVVQFRDGGGSYCGGEMVGSPPEDLPCLAYARMDSAGFADITYEGKPVNAIIV